MGAEALPETTKGDPNFNFRLQLFTKLIYTRITLQQNYPIDGHCGPYSATFTLAIRPRKKNPNPKPRFCVFILKPKF